MHLPSGKETCLASEDDCPYLVDYITCEQQPQRLNSTEESVRAVAGAGRVTVADVTWGTRTDVDPINDSFARGVDHGSGGPETLS